MSNRTISACLAIVAAAALAACHTESREPTMPTAGASEPASGVFESNAPPTTTSTLPAAPPGGGGGLTPTPLPGERGGASTTPTPPLTPVPAPTTTAPSVTPAPVPGANQIAPGPMPPVVGPH